LITVSGPVMSSKRIAYPTYRKAQTKQPELGCILKYLRFYFSTFLVFASFSVFIYSKIPYLNKFLYQSWERNGPTKTSQDH